MRNLLNRYGRQREPIFFVIDFNLENFYISPLKSLDPDIYFSIDDDNKKVLNKKKEYNFQAISFSKYNSAFKKVQKEIKDGNTYLINLTSSSKIDIDYNLKEIYDYTDAKFKLYFKDKFVCFTPERFVNIKNNTISTYPMKGTIEASSPNAKEKILSDKKEMAEHVMVVDLLRNDLNRISKKVKVNKFRYIERIKAGERELLQVSSKISGKLQENWQDRLGDILLDMLPAGSITGAPKISTTKIIKKVEEHKRGYFSGVFGLFDGKNLDSAVMIRFIEKTKDGLVYKSGGGITIDSDAKAEYQEMCEKIYVPFF